MANKYDSIRMFLFDPCSNLRQTCIENKLDKTAGIKVKTPQKA